MELTKSSSFERQIILYLKNRDYPQAYSLSKDFISRFPEVLSAHIFLANAAFELGKYEEARDEARKAFNIATSPDDMMACALLASAAYYRLKEYAKGYEILSVMEGKKKTEDLEELLVLFSLMLDDPSAAAKHSEELFKISSQAARELLERIARGLPPE